MVDVGKMARWGATGAAESAIQMTYEAEASNYCTTLPAHRISTPTFPAAATGSEDERGGSFTSALRRSTNDCSLRGEAEESAFSWAGQDEAAAYCAILLHAK